MVTLKYINIYIYFFLHNHARYKHIKTGLTLFLSDVHSHCTYLSKGKMSWIQELMLLLKKKGVGELCGETQLQDFNG